MDNNLEKSVIIYRSEDGTIQLEVQLYNGTQLSQNLRHFKKKVTES
jgi:hypothetical protein